MCLAIPGEIRSVSGETPLDRSGIVRFGEIEREASLAFVPEAVIGDYVLVHAGVAITVVRPEEARRVFEYLDQIGEVRP